MTSKTIVELSTQTMLSDYVTAIAWSPLGNLLAVGTGSGEVHLQLVAGFPSRVNMSESL